MAPAGIRAVTAGRAAGQRSEPVQTLSRWKIHRQAGPPALAANRFIRTLDSVGSIQVAT